MDDEGNIDFKQRGEIPLVEKGTVLAEKTPRVKERAGLNIHGEDVAMSPSKDTPMKFGKGAVLSEDGFKLLAGVRGYPKFSLGGWSLSTKSTPPAGMWIMKPATLNLTAM